MAHDRDRDGLEFADKGCLWLVTDMRQPKAGSPLEGLGACFR